MEKVGTHIIDQYDLRGSPKEDLRQLLELCHENLDETDDELITRAFKLCYTAHKGMKRASGEPYYHHPVEVAKIIASDLTIDDEAVVAALLHDIVEDTDVTLEDIRMLFGENVAHIIDGVTKVTLGMVFSTEAEFQTAKSFGAVELGLQTLGKLERFVASR